MKHLLPLAGMAMACLLSQCAYQGDLTVTTPSVLPAEFCYVDTVAPSVRVDLKYAGPDNFTGRRVAGYTGKRAVLRRDAADALRVAADSLAKQGYGLLIWDAYRPAMALRDFRAWAASPDDSTRARFYPNITKQEIYSQRFIGDISEHSWGVAVDITLVRLSDGAEVDMGTRHDFLDAAAATDSPLVSATQRANRHILRTAMENAGFRNYSKEWWHFYYKNLGLCCEYNFRLNDHLRQAPDPRRGN